MTGALRVEVLGPLRVLWEGEPVAVGAHRNQTLLAVLALRANQVCTPEELLDAVWQDNPPGTGLKVVPPYIYRLRQALPEDVLGRTSDGYILRLAEGALDVSDFEAAAAQAQVHRANGDLEAAAGEYARALGLFRGEPFAGLAGRYLEAQRHRLAERRDKVFGDRVDLDLERGRSSELVAELVPVVTAKPFDERLAGQLMRALAADGRQAEALELYTRTRDILIDQLGVEPGAALREVHRTILRNEAAESVRDELPYAGSTFVGREAELAQLTRVLAGTGASAPPVVAIDGMGGVGKTALAVHIARRLAGQYPDGVLFVDLHGHTPEQSPRDAKAALDHLLVGAGVVPKKIPQDFEEARALWRTTVAGRRLLIVLDNAPDSGTVAPLLPGSPTCGVLITSRNQLTGLDVRERLHLDLLTASDAAALLAELIGDNRSVTDVAAGNGLIERCGHLPLALRIAGARLRHRKSWTIAHINDRLDRAGRRLSELTVDGVGVTAAFELSYEQLSPEQQSCFRLLSLLPGRDLDQYGAAALLDCEPDDASDLAESLVDANLLLQPRPGRYQFHDLLREYASELAQSAESAESRDAATDRLLEYYIQAAIHPRRLQVGARYLERDPESEHATPTLETRDEAVAWADAEADNLTAATELAARTGRHHYTWRLVLVSTEYLQARGKVHQLYRGLDLALAAAEQTGDREIQARVLYATGRIIRARQGSRAAADRLKQALATLPPDGELLLRAKITCSLGQALIPIDPFGEALPTLQEAARLAELAGNDRLVGDSLAFGGLLYANEQEFEKAVPIIERAIVFYRRFDPSRMTAGTYSTLSYCYRGLGRTADALDASRASLEMATELGDSYCTSFALATLAAAHRQQGELVLAVGTARRALQAGRDSGVISAQWAARLELGNSLLAVGDHDAAREQFHQVLEEAIEYDDNAHLVESREGLASVAAAIGDLDTATEYLTQALEIAEKFLPSRVGSLRKQLAELTG
ncbi:tetratricopeptide repeat protein [Kribbella sp. NBC_01505]|uniref:AfsR/SARP family transcriptional regulator n=1 Tax=Kribbella sp. NBC_01505 TaxID=2903580 RepID=UPI0038700A9C